MKKSIYKFYDQCHEINEYPNEICIVGLSWAYSLRNSVVLSVPLVLESVEGY